MVGEDPLRLDLRSDAVTLPTAEMWSAMQEATLGWAHAGEDRFVNELESTCAELVEKEAGLFVHSGSVGNLIAVMSHTQRGDQVVLEESSHIAWSEEWGVAYVCGVYPRLVAGERGVIKPEALERVIGEQKLRHRPTTSLICLENTHNFAGGAAITADETAAVAELAESVGSAVHLDGARIFNAAVALDATLPQLARADSVVINLNKGLSAPGGAVLVGAASFIAACRVNLKRIGGTSHQAGLIAAAGLIGLQTMLPQLAEDNRRARLLAERLSRLPQISLPFGDVDTNIVICELHGALTSADRVTEEIARVGVRALPSSPTSVRFVTHRHVDDAAVEFAAEAVRSALEAGAGASAPRAA